jgi:thioredoxin 1
MTLDVTGKNFETEVLDSETPVLVDFKAVWCGPCRVMKPTIDKLADEYRGRVKVVTLDIDDGPELAAEYGIRGVPTFILFNEGEVIERWVGSNTTRDMFVQKFSELLEENSN